MAGTRLTVTKIPNLNQLVIKQYGGREFFISAPDSIIMSVSSLAFILQFLLENGFMPVEVLQKILDQYNIVKGDTIGRDVGKEIGNPGIR
jgi:hypothetical protein